MCKESFGKEIMNILDIIFPRRCPLCDEVIPPDGKICPECIGKAELFAKEIGKRTGIPVETKLLYRCINTRPQKELNDQERKKNLKKAFTIAQNIVQLRKVLLVDDIYTTGSTVDAAAECLKVSGIQEVYVLCISIGRGH